MRINRICLYLLLIFSGYSLSGCNSQSFNTSGQVRDSGALKKAKDIFSRATEFGDYQTAIYATYEMMSVDSANTGYLDTLSFLYYNARSFPQAIRTASKSLKLRPKSEKILFVMANSLKEMHNNILARTYFLKLEEVTKNASYGYEAAVMSFLDAKYEASAEEARALIARAAQSQNTVAISTEDKTQQVPVQAAAWNLIGYSYLKQNKKSEAKENFNKAIEIYPQFELAQANLRSLK